MSQEGNTVTRDTLMHGLKATDKFVKEIDRLVGEKEKEIMTV